MYCRTCGNQVVEQAVVCVKCGCPPWKGASFCQSCATQTTQNQELCLKCGAKLTNNAPNNLSGDDTQRDWVVTLLLCFFLGFLGVHRFYTKHTAIGIIQLLTAGLCGIWVLIDFIMILVGSFRDAQGRPLAKR